MDRELPHCSWIECIGNFDKIHPNDRDSAHQFACRRKSQNICHDAIITPVSHDKSQRINLHNHGSRHLITHQRIRRSFHKKSPAGKFIHVAEQIQYGWRRPLGSILVKFIPRIALSPGRTSRKKKNGENPAKCFFDQLRNLHGMLLGNWAPGRHGIKSLILRPREFPHWPRARTGFSNSAVRKRIPHGHHGPKAQGATNPHQKLFK